MRIAIENCPMIFSYDEWPGDTNLAYDAAAIWREMFELVPSGCFGLNFDPSHLVWQMIDWERAISEFAPRIFHVHAKDLGEVRRDRFMSALYAAGYDGYVVIEHETASSKERTSSSSAASTSRATRCGPTSSRLRLADVVLRASDPSRGGASMGFLDKLLGRGKQVASGAKAQAGDVVEKGKEVAGDVVEKGVDVAADVAQRGVAVGGAVVEKGADVAGGAFEKAKEIREEALDRRPGREPESGSEDRSEESPTPPGA